MYDKRNKMENIYLMLLRAFPFSFIIQQFYVLAFQGIFALLCQWENPQRLNLVCWGAKAFLLIYQKNPIYSFMRVIRRSQGIHLS